MDLFNQSRTNLTNALKLKLAMKSCILALMFRAAIAEANSLAVKSRGLQLQGPFSDNLLSYCLTKQQVRLTKNRNAKSKVR
jgi:hypothetical protein